MFNFERVQYKQRVYLKDDAYCHLSVNHPYNRVGGCGPELSPLRSVAEADELFEANENMAAKGLRQRTRRVSSRQDASNANVPAEARIPKEEKGSDESKLSETRQE